MRVSVRPCKNKLLGIFIALFFSGPGVIFYIDFIRGVLVTIVEVYIMVKYGIVLGLIIGSIFAILLSWPKLKEYEEKYKRLKVYEEIDYIEPEICPDAVIIITTPEGLKRVWKRIPKEHSLFLHAG